MDNSMDKKDIEFQKRILATFRIEAEGTSSVLFSTCLIELEKTHSKKKAEEVIEVMFREIHSLKGAARSVDQKDIEYVCQPLESIFSSLKRGEITLSIALVVRSLLQNSRMAFKTHYYPQDHEQTDAPHQTRSGINSGS